MPLYTNVVKEVKKERKENIGEYARAKPLPQWCEWMAMPCNTYCGYFVCGQCAWDKVDDVPDLTNATITNRRDWYLKQINEINQTTE